MSEIGSRVSDDNSMLAEKGSVVGGDVSIDDDDDDWEGVESTELDEAFSAASAFVAATVADKLSNKAVTNDVQLQLYGLYKIATEGPCSGLYPPPKYKITARAKWNAWQKLGAMPPEDAMQKYVDIVTELFPSRADGGADKTKDGDSGTHVSESKGPMGPVFSSFVHEGESGNELKMDAIHTFAREGDVDNLLKCIESSISVDSKDSEGRTPLHWAVNRGHLGVIELLLSKNADVNAKDNEGQTPLHYAIVCDREAIAEYLVKHNANVHVKDHDDTTPKELCQKNWAFMQTESKELGLEMEGSGTRYTHARGVTTSTRKQRERGAEVGQSANPSQKIRIKVPRNVKIHVDTQEDEPYQPEPVPGNEFAIAPYGSGVYQGGQSYLPYGYELDEVGGDEDADDMDYIFFAEEYEPDIDLSPRLQWGGSLGQRVVDSDEWVLREGLVGGPIDGSVVPSLCGHIAYTMLTEDKECWRELLRCQNRYQLCSKLGRWRALMPLDARRLIDGTGLSHIPGCIHKHIDWALISAFVERWQPDTNSFHLPFGEMTILLHDVYYIMNIPVDGGMLGRFGPEEFQRLDVCIDSLFLKDPAVLGLYTRGAYKRTIVIDVAMKFLKRQDYIRQARGWLTLALTYGLFTDKSSNRLKPKELLEVEELEAVSNYSWGSATLAYLYRQLGISTRKGAKGVSGCLSLLQSWIYEYFPCFRPGSKLLNQRAPPLAAYWSDLPKTSRGEERLWAVRKALDKLTITDVTWLPYVDISSCQPPILTYYRGLISYRDVVEPYMPDRCVRQLGYVQRVPHKSMQPRHVYRGVKSARYKAEWPEFMVTTEWEQRHAKLYTQLDRFGYPGETVSEYLEWYNFYCVSFLGLVTEEEMEEGPHPSVGRMSRDELISTFFDCMRPFHEHQHVLEMARRRIPAYEPVYLAYQDMFDFERALRERQSSSQEAKTTQSTAPPSHPRHSTSSISGSRPKRSAPPAGHSRRQPRPDFGLY